METVKDYFGSLVFDDRVMKATLSAKVYASLKKTIDEGTELDIGVANAVAGSNKRLGGNQGRDSLHALVPTAHRYNRRKTRQLYIPFSRRRSYYGVFRQGAYKG